MTLRAKLQEALDYFSGSTVYLVGGGNSFNNEQLKLIENKKTIALNTTFMKLPNASMIFWMDSSWPCNYLHELDAHPAKFRFQSRHNATSQIINNNRGLGDSLYLNHLGPKGFSTDINSVYGNNSGTQCLNLLINLKVKKIVMLGFDMQSFMGKTHHHDDYTHVVTQDVYDDLFIPSMNTLANLTQDKKVEIINCSIVSRLDCFRKDDLINHLQD